MHATWSTKTFVFWYAVGSADNFSNFFNFFNSPKKSKIKHQSLNINL